MYDLLIGAPGETRASIRNTVELMQEVKPDRAGFSIGVRVYPRTELARIVQEEGLSNNPNLIGTLENNQDFLKPLYYLSSEMGGESVFAYISETNQDASFNAGEMKDEDQFFGPYLSEMPTNPLNDKKTVKVLSEGAEFPAQVTGEFGWLYKPSIKAIVLDYPGEDKHGVKYVDY